MKDSNKIIKVLSENEIVNEIDFLKKAFSNIGTSFGKKTQEDSTNKLQRLSPHSYKFGNNIILYLEIFGIPESSYLDFIVQNKEIFRWLFDGAYYAQYVSVDSRNGVFDAIVAQWMDGVFSKGILTSSSNRIKVDYNRIGFYGGQFNGGEFYLPYEYWQASPQAFFKGIMPYTQNGLLGLSNANNGVIEEPIHLIQVPVGKYIIIKMVGKTKLHAIQVRKRIDEKNENFVFVYEENPFFVSWESIRSKFNTFYLAPNKTNFVIPGVVNLKGKVESVEIVDNISNIGKKQLGVRKKGSEYPIQLNRLSQVFGNIDLINIIPTQEQIVFAHDISNDFGENKGRTFLKHLDNIINEIRLSGKYFNINDLKSNGLNYIDNLFRNALFENINSDDLKSLKYINNFLILMKNSGKIKEIQQSIINYIKKELHGQNIESEKIAKEKESSQIKKTDEEPSVSISSIKKGITEMINVFLEENKNK